MKYRPVLIALLVIWGIFATAAFQNCGRRAPPDTEPVYHASLSSTDPSEVSQAYWLAAREARKRAGRAMIKPEELQRQVQSIKSPADGKRVWAELAESYAHSATVNTEVAGELKSLPRDRVDPLALECVTELAEFLTLQADLLRQTGEGCGEYAALYATIHAEGEDFDCNSRKGAEYQSREAGLIAKMKQTEATEGAADKRRLAELSTKTKNAASALAKKHGRDFPDLLGH
jgi:hypothetical protein